MLGRETDVQLGGVDALVLTLVDPEDPHGELLANPW
jgi:hypothetical protein